MQAVKDLVHEFRELKAAAEAHNLHADPDTDAGADTDPGGSGVEGKTSHSSGAVQDASTTVTTVTAAVPGKSSTTVTTTTSGGGGEGGGSGSSGSGSGGRPTRLSLTPLATVSPGTGSTTIHEWHGIPPPPPRNLPHGWTARYDEKEKKYAYAHGVTAQEQWDFPTDTAEPPQLPLDEDHSTSATEPSTAALTTTPSTIITAIVTATAVATATATATAVTTATTAATDSTPPKGTPPEDLIAEDVD